MAGRALNKINLMILDREIPADPLLEAVKGATI